MFLNAFEDNPTVPKYDLIVLDEIESLLNQFSSEKTFGGKNEDSFNYMTEIIKLSCKKGKIIRLDGDMDDRSYSYLSQFGKSINIKIL